MKIALRIAAVLILLHTLGHTMGALTWKNAPNVRVAAVVTGMENEHFDFMGRSLTLASFFNGYGFIMIGVLLLISILLWLLSSAPVRSMILLLGCFWFLWPSRNSSISSHLSLRSRCSPGSVPYLLIKNQKRYD
ncbi:hypothetical protein [Mucilaginibacter sp.]|uniref:LIC_13387 family protein n=1 Tax=Mucilaginibacter sp. TaxID=1882438 RepID=UPI00262CFA44|nr:hypothetical protein [Mucilaginibacter sp.]MDB4923306.1 hypothetical protein [Mucilaginibacter sp.]